MVMGLVEGATYLFMLSSTEREQVRCPFYFSQREDEILAFGLCTAQLKDEAAEVEHGSSGF
jgi:hypothetical protein